MARTPNPLAIKSLGPSGQPNVDQWASTVAAEKEPQSAYGPGIAQTALQSVGMSTRSIYGPFIGPPEYALAVSLIFTKATEQTIMLGTPPNHVCSTSILWNSLAHDKRFTQVAMSEAAPGDIIIEPGWQKAADGYAGIVVDHGRIVSNSSQGVQNDSSLIEIQHNRQEMAIFRYIGVQAHPSYSLANAFNPDEPRVPAGQSGGGQWTAGMAPSTTVLSGGNNWTPGGRKSSSGAGKDDGKAIDKPNAANGLTDAQRRLLEQKNAEALAIIARLGEKGESPDTPESILNGPLKSTWGSNLGWMPGTPKWDLRQQYKGYSDQDIALMEAARRNGVRALVLLAQAGQLPKSQVTALQLRGMGVLADATLNLGLALAPYASIGALGSRALLGTTEGVISAGAGRAAASTAEETGIGQKVISGEKSLATDTPNVKLLKKGEVTTYQDFVDRSVVGDNLEGHELWQHANMNEHGLTDARLSTPASQKNPVIVLDKSKHAEVNAVQKGSNVRTMTPGENITANAQILHGLNAAPPEAVDAAKKAALEHARNYGY